MNDDLISFRLLKDQLPGKDLFSKKLLKTQEVIDLVADELLNVPKGTYISAGTEWNNGSRSDILYMPRLPIQKSLPPILIEIQQVVNEAFMQRLINYSQNASNIYGNYPIALVFCIEKVSPIHITKKFTPVPESLWMSSLASTDFWAKNCFLVSKATLSNVITSDELTPLQALSLFLMEGSPTLYGHSHAENKTIQQLYRISLTIFENQMEEEQDISNVVNIVCQNNETILSKIDDALSSVPGSSKARNLVKRGLMFNMSAKRKYCQAMNSDSDSSLEPLPKLKGKAKELTKQDDVEFLIDYRKNLIGKMNWKRCLEIGHEKGLFKRYSTGESLRRFYYNETNK